MYVRRSVLAISIVLLAFLASTLLFCASSSESFSYNIKGVFSVVLQASNGVEYLVHSLGSTTSYSLEQSVSVESNSYRLVPEHLYEEKQSVSTKNNVYNINVVFECLYEEGCRLYDAEGNVVREPNDSWVIPELSYRLPIVYVLLTNQAPITVVINDSNLVSWILGNGSVAVAIGNQALQPTDFDVYNVTETTAVLKVGIKPNSFGGTCDDVWIRLSDGTWLKPVKVVSATSGHYCYGYFKVEPRATITAVGMHHTSAGWSDPTTVVIYNNLTGDLLYQTTVSSHTWDDSIYGSSYFEYVTVSYTVPTDIPIEKRTYVELVLNVVPSDPYGFIYLYYGTGGGSLIEQVQTKSSLDPATEIIDPCSIVQLRNQFVTPTTTPPATATSTSRFTFSWSVSYSFPRFSVVPPSMVFETPKMYTERGILMLALFLGLYVIYSRIFGAFQALVASGAISFLVAFILFGFDWTTMVLMTLAFAAIAAWKILGK